MRAQLRRLILVGLLSIPLALSACVETSDVFTTSTDDATTGGTDTTEPTAVATTLPGQFQQPSLAGSAGGQATGKRYQAVFSLGGAVPPHVSETWRLGPPTQPPASK